MRFEVRREGWWLVVGGWVLAFVPAQQLHGPAGDCNRYNGEGYAEEQEERPQAHHLFARSHDADARRQEEERDVLQKEVRDLLDVV